MARLLYILIIFNFLGVSCSDESDHVYIKYVYSLPQNLAPYESVNEVDIWFSRLKHRGLTKIVAGNLIELDLAKKVETKDFKVFNISLKEDQRFSNGKKISNQNIKKSIDHFKQHYKGEMARNIDKVIIKNNEIIIVLKKENRNFKMALASHLFLVFDPMNLNISSGAYKFDSSNKKYLRVLSASELPQYVVPRVIKSSDEIKTNIRFDTALLPSGVIKKNNSTKEYTLFETWGLIINLKNQKLNSVNKRKCLGQSINRFKLIENVVPEHDPVTHLDGQNVALKSCDFKENLTVDIPIEIGDKAQRFCKELKNNLRVTCHFVNFSKLLENLADDAFELSLLSLTLDLPYVESFNEYLVSNASFSILNQEVKLPENLTHSYGDEYLKNLSSFIANGAYFIPLSRPKRMMQASKIELYKPSMIAPSYDSIENLIR